jgi:hypothetical protein
MSRALDSGNSPGGRSPYLPNVTSCADPARVYAWLGANDEACQQLAIATRLPGDISYGELQLHPDWDGLRGDHSFDQILASLKGRP